MENEKKRRIFIAENDPSMTAIRRAVEAVGGLTNELVEDPEMADLIIVFTSEYALEILKETDETTIVMIAVMPGMYARSELIAARSLRRAYPDRVVVGRLFDPDVDEGDVLMVEYLIRISDKKDEETNK